MEAIKGLQDSKARKEATKEQKTMLMLENEIFVTLLLRKHGYAKAKADKKYGFTLHTNKEG